MKLSIVIPCYNEEKNIPLILERFNDIITSDDIEVVVVNNGSKDKSQVVIASLLADYPFVNLVHLKENKGYGAGVLAGLAHAKGTFLGWTHADMQTDPADLIKALTILENSEDPVNTFVKGNRKSRPLFDSFFTVGMSLFETVYLRTSLWDINAQPNVFHKDFYEQWKNPPNDFALDLFVYFSARKKSLRVKRFDVFFPERLHGTSSWNTGLYSKWKFIKRTISFSMNLKKAVYHDAHRP
jgi:glycosyltransferase involved in cell wall biosynthesis